MAQANDTNPSSGDTPDGEIKFQLGACMITPDAKGALTPAEQAELLARHQRGDWGAVTRHDAWENNYALGKHLRILSVYTVRDIRVWVITEADRSATTILLPEEY